MRDSFECSVMAGVLHALCVKKSLGNETLNNSVLTDQAKKKKKANAGRDEDSETTAN